ncbi:putative phage abortive infection protein [Halosquirtibacter laminarini]|uniref:Phage abortive infection protein n=1 Tax=Halosquirtibacter laminarini TaxID=3374600 RepID=A0AC61NII6_9BACT|nr:putative phage abortive infection protein [Prolixibacteraceae bacterium]
MNELLLFIWILMQLAYFEYLLEKSLDDKKHLKVCILSDILNVITITVTISLKLVLFSYIQVIVYILIRFYIHKLYKSKVYVDFCLIPIVSLLAIKYLSLCNTVDLSCAFSKIIFKIKIGTMSETTDWDVITACVGWVTFWAFWAQLKANELASDDAKRSGIQDTFNSMMETYNRNLLNLRFNDNIGLDAIDNYVLIINDLIKVDSISTKDFYLAYSYFYFIRKKNDINRLKKTFLNGYPVSGIENYEMSLEINRSNHSALSTYYYQLYRIVKYIVVDNKDFLDEEEKKKYIGILRAQMSPNEQLLLFYNWLAGDQMNKIGNGLDKQFGYSWENIEKKNYFFSEHKVIKHLNTLELEDDLIKLCKAKNFIS